MVIRQPGKEGTGFSLKSHFLTKGMDISGSFSFQSPGPFPHQAASREGQQLNRWKELSLKYPGSVKLWKYLVSQLHLPKDASWFIRSIF